MKVKEIGISRKTGIDTSQRDEILFDKINKFSEAEDVISKIGFAKRTDERWGPTPASVWNRNSGNKMQEIFISQGATEDEIRLRIGDIDILLIKD